MKEETMEKIQKEIKGLKEDYSKQKHQLGITLVALMVTIIVLLILSGVTIAELTGNGLFVKAQIAKERQKDAEGIEQNRLSDYEKQISSTRDVGGANPIGTVISCIRKTAPENYLICDGTEYEISQYPELAEELKNVYGNYNTETSGKFKVPDLRGEFLRGAGNDGGNVGEHQDNGLPNITGYQNTYVDIGRGNGVGALYRTDDGADFTGTGTSGGTRYNRLGFDASRSNNIYGAATEVRPTNTSVLYCIKAK